MSLSVAVLDAMVAAGCTAAQIVAILKADLAFDVATRRRSPNAARQARYRARQRLARAGTMIASVRAAAPLTAMADLATSPVTQAVTRNVTSVTHLARPGAVAEVVTRPRGAGTEPNKAVARRALVLAGLPASVVKVGSTLIDHFNLETGRCDPATARIAGLCGLSARSVRRASAALHAAGLIVRVLHGGHSHTNAFMPDWARLRQIVDGFESSVKAATQRVTRNATWPNLAAEVAKTVHQTPLKNPDINISRGESRRTAPPRQMAMYLPIPGGRANAEQALEAAKGRWFRDFNQRHKGSTGYQALLAAVAGLSSEAVGRIDQAEFSRPGSGVVLAEREIEAAHGPPRAGLG